MNEKVKKIFIGVGCAVLLVGIFVVGRCTSPVDQSAIVDRINQLGTKIESLESNIAGQLGAIEKSSIGITSGLDAIGDGQSRIASTVDRMAVRLQTINGKLDGVAIGIEGAKGIATGDTDSLERLYGYLKQLDADLSNKNKEP